MQWMARIRRHARWKSPSIENPFFLVCPPHGLRKCFVFHAPHAHALRERWMGRLMRKRGALERDHVLPTKKLRTSFLPLGLLGRLFASTLVCGALSKCSMVAWDVDHLHWCIWSICPTVQSLGPRPAMALLARWDARARLGMVLVLTVATLWVAASFFVQSIEEKGIPPLLLTYVANSLFVLYLPMHALVRRWRSSMKERIGTQGSTLDRIEQQKETTITYRGMEMENLLQAGATKRPEVTDQETAKAALKISPLWFVAEWTFNASLMSTSIGSNTILSSSSNMFTFLLAVLLIGEAFTITKLASISTVIVGIIAVSVADSEPSNATGGNSMVGDALCLLSALCYGLFTVILRKELADDERVSMTFFFGCVGLFNLAIFLPVILVYAFYHPGFFQITSSDLGLCLIKGLFDNVLSDYLWARAVLLLGPTLATVGLSLEVPMAIVAEFLVGHAPWAGHFGRTFLTFLGGALVLGGFFGLQREELVDEAYL